MDEDLLQVYCDRHVLAGFFGTTKYRDLVSGEQPGYSFTEFSCGFERSTAAYCDDCALM